MRNWTYQLSHIHLRAAKRCSFCSQNIVVAEIMKYTAGLRDHLCMQHFLSEFIAGRISLMVLLIMKLM